MGRSERCLEVIGGRNADDCSLWESDLGRKLAIWDLAQIALWNFHGDPKITNLALSTIGHVQKGFPITHWTGKMRKQTPVESQNNKD